MLTLTRRTLDRIVITMPDGTEGYVEVVKIKGDRVLLGFGFPAEVRIDRKEVHEQRKERAAAEKAKWEATVG